MTTDLTGDFELGEDEFDWDVFLPDPDEAEIAAEAAALENEAELDLDDSDFDWDAALREDPEPSAERTAQHGPGPPTTGSSTRCAAPSRSPRKSLRSGRRSSKPETLRRCEPERTETVAATRSGDVGAGASERLRCLGVPDAGSRARTTTRSSELDDSSRRWVPNRTGAGRAFANGCRPGRPSQSRSRSGAECEPELEPSRNQCARIAGDGRDSLRRSERR